jgi:hypothetical protein
LYGACDILVGMEQQCKDFVDEQLPIIIDLLVEQYLNPEGSILQNSISAEKHFGQISTQIATYMYYVICLSIVDNNL